jgi:hypothetical protein
MEEPAADPFVGVLCTVQALAQYGFHDEAPVRFAPNGALTRHPKSLYRELA